MHSVRSVVSYVIQLPVPPPATLLRPTITICVNVWQLAVLRFKDYEWLHPFKSETAAQSRFHAKKSLTRPLFTCKRKSRHLFRCPRRPGKGGRRDGNENGTEWNALGVCCIVWEYFSVVWASRIAAATFRLFSAAVRVKRRRASRSFVFLRLEHWILLHFPSYVVVVGVACVRRSVHPHSWRKYLAWSAMLFDIPCSSGKPTKIPWSPAAISRPWCSAEGLRPGRGCSARRPPARWERSFCRNGPAVIN